MPIFVLITRRVGGARRKITTTRQESMADISSLVQESLSVSGILLGKTMGRSAELAERFDGESTRLAELEVRSRMTGRWLMQSIQMTFAVMPALIYRFGGLAVRTAAARRRTRRSARSSRSRRCRCGCSRRSAACSSISVDVQSSLALFDRIFEYLDLRGRHRPGHARRSSTSTATSASTTSGSATATGAWALEGIDVTIPAGTTTAIVGETGAGKTTLGYLVSRLYDASKGAVTDRRRRHPRADVRVARRDRRRRLAGDLPLPRDRAREPPLREARRDRRGGRGGRARGADPRPDLVAPRGLRDRRRRARLPLLGRREAADGDRARDPPQPADPRARRGDLGARHPDRARGAGGARTASSRGARRSRSPTGSRPSATPTRSSSSTAAAWSRLGTYDELVALGGRFAALAARDSDTFDAPELGARLAVERLAGLRVGAGVRGRYPREMSRRCRAASPRP